MINRFIELVSFMDAMGVALIITLIPFFTKELGVSAFGFGLITSLYGLCQIIGGVLLTQLLNYGISRKTILMVSSVGSGISYFLLLFRNNIYTLVLSRALVGLIKQTTTSCKALVMMSTDNHGAQRFSLLAAVRHMGSFIGSALLTVLTKHYSERVAVIISVIIFILESIIIFFCIPDIKDNRSRSPSLSPSPPLQEKKVVHHMNVGYLSMIKAKVDMSFSVSSKLIIKYMMYLLFIDSINKGFGSIKIILLQDQFSVTPHEIGMVYLLSNLFMFITEFFITPILSRFISPYRIVFISLILLMAGKVFQMIIPNFTYYIIFCVVLNTVGEEVFATSFVNLLAKISPTHLVNHYLAYYDVVESICRLIGPLLLGKVISMCGYNLCEKILSTSFFAIAILWLFFPVTAETSKNKND